MALRIAIAAVALILVGSAIAARLRDRTVELADYGLIPPFSLQDQHGGAIDLSALQGRVTIVDFIFTSCSTACPLLSTEMAALQRWAQEHKLGDRVRLLSISVDPERDTAERLRAFAARYGADPSLWRFARGDEKALRAVVVDGMKQVMEKQADPAEVDGFGILHGTRMILVDGQARLRGFYDATDRDSMQALREAVRTLAEAAGR